MLPCGPLSKKVREYSRTRMQARYSVRFFEGCSARLISRVIGRQSGTAPGGARGEILEWERGRQKNGH